jgi:PAS domain S-box-containing protein
MTSGFRTNVWRYGGAVLVVVLATAIRLLLHPVLGENTPLLTYFPAVSLVAWLWGPRPTLLAVVLLGASVDYFFLGPRFGFGLERLDDWVTLAVFMAFGLITVMLSEQVSRARRRTEEKHALLLEEVETRRRAEVVLARERERWRATLACVGDGVVVTDAEGRVTFLNAVAESLTGWPQADAAGRPLTEAFHIVAEGDGRPAANPVARVLQSGRVQGLANHTVLIARDGTERAIDDSAAPIRGPDGALLGVVLVFRDVTSRRQQERKLRESEARFAAFVEHAPAAIFVKDPSGKYLLANGRVDELAGGGRNGVVGKSDADLLSPDVAARFAEIDRRILTTGRAETFEESFEHAGERLTFLTTKFPLPDAEGRPYAVCGIATDVSDRKRARDALEESERFHKAIAELTADFAFAADVRPDATATVTKVTEGFTRFFGWTFEEMNARGGWVGVIHPGDHPVVRRSIERLLAGESERGEIRGLTRAGPVKRLSYLIVPVRDPGDRVVGCYGAGKDVTAQRQAESARRELTERLREQAGTLEAILSASVDHIYLLDRQGCYRYVSAGGARILGYEVADVVGKHARELGLPAEITEPFDALRERVLATGKPERQQTDYRIASGETRHYEYLVAPVRGEDGGIDSVVVVSRDDTDRKRAEEALSESTAVLRSFYDSTPLMMGVVEVLEDDILHLNDNAATGRFFGLGPDDLRNRLASRSGVPPAHLREWIGHYRESARTGRPVRFEYLHRKPEQSHWLSVTVCHIETAADGRLRCSYLVEDVTDRKRAEEALRDAEARFTAILNYSPSCIFAKDRQGRYFLANKALCEFAGRDVANFCGRTDAEVFSPEVGVQFAADDAQILASGNARIYEESFPHGDAIRTFLTVKFPMAGPDGALYAVCGIATDITNLQHARDALRESETRWRTLAEAVPNLVWTDLPDGQCDYLSSQWATYTGLPVEELLGLNWLDRVIHPDDRERTAALWREACADRADYDLEYRIRRHDGVYHWFKTRGVPVRDQHNRIVYWFGTCTDIDEQRRAGEAFRFLAESSAALASLVDYESTLQKVARLAVPYFADWAAVDLVNEDGVLRRLAVAHEDPAKVELAHELVRRYPPAPDSSGGAARVARTGKPETVADLTDDMLVRGALDADHLRLLRALGLKSYICVPLAVAGKTLGVLTFATAQSGRSYSPSDVALAEDLAHRAAVAVENSNLYRALREADRRKDEFLAMLAHELRNPLAPIRNALHIMRLAADNPAVVEQFRNVMERQVVQMVRLVDDLLDVNRITRNKLELRRERVELADVVASAVETSRPALEEGGHALTVTLPPEPVHLYADATRLSQVFANLLNNSAKYTDRGGSVQLAAELRGGEAVVRVRDNGVGIPAEALPRLFEMFSQVDRNLERAAGGLGIGLTLVRRLVEMHGGTVAAFSDGPGRGSEFVVRLPVVHAGARPEDARVAGSGDRGVAPKRRILVVDDNRDAANSLSVILAMLDNETRTAYDGRQALEVVDEFRPDLILLDIGLPGMNGYEVCQQIRARPRGKAIVIAACTGWGQDEDRRRSSEAGFDHHLVKPIDPADLQKLLGLSRSPR